MFEVRFTISDTKNAKEFIAEICDAAKQVAAVSDLKTREDGVEMRFGGNGDELTVFLNALTAHLTDKFSLDKLPIELETKEISSGGAAQDEPSGQSEDAWAQLVGAAEKLLNGAAAAADDDTDEDADGETDGDTDDETGDESDDDIDDFSFFESTGINPEGANAACPSAEEMQQKADALIGAAEFKALIREIVGLRQMTDPALAEVVGGRSYVFSIEDGHGLTTYLEMLGQALSPLVQEGRPMRVVESALPRVPDKQGELEMLYSRIGKEVSGSVFGGGRRDVICFDISEWMGVVDTEMFRKCLDAIVDNNGNGSVIVFRVPYVDKSVLSRVCYAINDRMGVKAVSFAPLTQDELAEYARREFERLGFTLADEARQVFFEKIREEKADGRFYGMRTVTKVVRDMVYNRLVTMAKTGGEQRVVGVEDASKSLFKELSDGKSAQEELDALIGCEKIKRQIKEIVAQISSAKKGRGRKRPCIHMRFVGSPGTGKTTIARILGKLLKEKGVLRVGAFYEHGARDLCGRYIGETSPKTSQICRDAYGSVLFLDEAYSLSVKDSDKDFGREAIDTLIAEMENHRDDFVVIMAGYTDEMEELMELNPGLRSRMPYKVEFNNYSRKELFEIFKQMSTSSFKCDKDMLAAAKEFFDDLSEEFITSKGFSNGRYVRNLFERTWAKAALRWQMSGCDDQTLTKEDFDKAKAESEFSPGKKRARIGFLT